MKSNFLPLLTVIVLLLLTPACTPTTFAPEDYPEVDRLTLLPDDVVKGSPTNDSYPPILHVDEFEPPVPIPGQVNTSGGEDSPFILPDGQTLYFFFTPDVRLPHDVQINDGITGIYVSHLSDGEWGAPERIWLAPPHTLAMDGAVSIQGNTMWFASVREGYEGIQFFTADWIDERWQNWQPVGDRLTKEIQIGEVHPVGDDLYFHSDRPGGLGEYDIWKTSLVDGRWADPMNIEAVNSTESDGWPCISPNGRLLWFTRTLDGTPAIYRSKWTAEGWSSPELILSQFAGEPTVDAEGNLYFVHHYFKNGTMLEVDLYVAYKK